MKLACVLFLFCLAIQSSSAQYDALRRLGGGLGDNGPGGGNNASVKALSIVLPTSLPTRDPYREMPDGTEVSLTPMFQAYAEAEKANSLGYPPAPIPPREGQMGQAVYQHNQRQWEQQRSKIDVQKQSAAVGWAQYSGYIVGGRVLSIRSDGLLLSRAGQSEPIFLKNYPGQESVVDGCSIQCVAFIAGRYRYTAVSRAAKTVIAYDYGKPVPKTDRTKPLPPLEKE